MKPGTSSSSFPSRSSTTTRVSVRLARSAKARLGRVRLGRGDDEPVAVGRPAGCEGAEPPARELADVTSVEVGQEDLGLAVAVRDEGDLVARRRRLRRVVVGFGAAGEGAQIAPVPGDADDVSRPARDRPAREEHVLAVPAEAGLHVEPGRIAGERARAGAGFDQPEVRSSARWPAPLSHDLASVGREARPEEEVARPAARRDAPLARLEVGDDEARCGRPPRKA